ncbi:hypothetical protein METBIDRAFT_30663 [Metschnikowia bicuspidata var. bicuspidata NRRL YB-4993]|uniref:Uncharacterized protein n=1 Tax=Metschnikowia bicuspidata var. bicuspidata NRRL YB-4993 TaxID=869754 RepID=A0A1A0HKP5_9ASCO|nr:hypothetical protein METBIDRAFT_30663 [Metschnikowia bicuspidata var. bicuspidata NRRL YB-4993]OBA24378.1 hypothetical protein METBIDRAFT_30663 [Metschnikowia bicuspidata var. bicuspidata NRRL YB-4993]
MIITTPHITKLNSVAEELFLYHILLLLAGIYIGALLIVNLIPRLRVRSIGWLSLCGVTVAFPEVTITVKKIYLKLNLSWKSLRAFRLATLQFSGVVIVKNNHPRKAEHNTKSDVLDLSIEEISFTVPKLVHDVVFKKSWLNEISLQFYHVSLYHHAVNEDVSLHLDYVKIESATNFRNATGKIAISILDGRVNNTAKGGEAAGLHLFHNLEISTKCDLVFSCSTTNSKRLKVSLLNFDVLLILGHLRIRRLSQLLERKKDIQRGPKKNPLVPSLKSILSKLCMISSLQVKLEQSEVQFEEVKLTSSSYSLTYSRDMSYKKQTMAKFSLNVTAARLFHLDLKCVDVPSITYILDIDLTDLFRASKTEKKEDFTIDLFTTLSMTNPSFFVYFDQLAYLLDLFSPGSNAKSKKISVSKATLLSYLAFIKKSSVKFVIVDLKAQLHLPKEEQQDFLRQSLENVVSDAGAQVLAFKFSSKNLGNLISKKCLSSNPAALKSFIKLRKVYVEVENNKILLSALSVLVGYCLETHKIALRISTKRMQLKSVNSMIFHVIRRVREARIMSDIRACAKMKETTEAGNSEPVCINDDSKKEVLDLFEVLPPIIHLIKFRSTVLLSYIICNDWLPLHVIHDEGLGEDVDLADFKRGISFGISGLEFDYVRLEAEFETRLKQIQANTISDYSSEYVEDFDKRNSDPLGEVEMSDASSLESGFSGFSLFEARENAQTVKKVLNIEGITLRNPPGNRNKLLLSIPEVEGRADIYLVWCVLYAHTLVEMIEPNVENTYTKEEVRKVRGVSKRFELDVEIASLSVVVRLPHDVDILFEIDNLNLRNSITSPHCQICYLRLYVVHPTTKLWSRLVSVTDVDINLDLVTRSSILLQSRALRFNIPFQFLVYTVIDNVITFFKAARQIWINFKHLSKDISEFSRIEPEAKEAIRIPRIQLKSKVMGITLESDEFETQLSLIQQFGAVENVERRRKLATFEKKAKALRSRLNLSLSNSPVEDKRFVNKKGHRRKPNVLAKALFNTTNESERNKSTKKTSKSSAREEVSGNEPENEDDKSSKSPRVSILKEVFSGCDHKASHANSAESLSKADSSDPEVPAHHSLTEPEVESLIADAYEKLLQDFSSSWVNKFERFKRSYDESWRRRLEGIWGSDCVNKLMKCKFDIQEYSRGPPQFQGIFKDLNLIVDDPHLNDVHEFLRTYGKNQPHTQYSILVPASIHWRSSSVYLSLRDYALPFLSFPSSSDPESQVMDLKGTLVINEKLVQIPEELRHIFVPFSPATRSQRVADNFYSVNVIRTLTPVKVMFNLESNLTTDRACVVSWCKAYQPALLSAMMAFENFTKPEIDDSPLGWWDKLALIAHGKIKFNIKHELCLHMKSSISPYSLIGSSSGLVFCWKDNVLLRINETGKHSELVLLESDDFILGIPNYSATEGQAWSLLNANADDTKTDGDSETGKFQKRIMKLTSDEKVKWSAGFLFERNKKKDAKELGADMERTNIFKPHYDVTVTGPQYEFHPDSYEEFRSDYTHLSINVNSSSKKGNSHNFAYFTPLTLEYIKIWWKTLNDNVSLPIREGKLFAKLAFKESSVKFGPHLFTLKYQIVLEPLTISHIYLSSGGKETNHNVVAYGVKGKASKCTIDLHQRREIARYVNEKLGIDKKIRKLKMNLGEVEVREADLRLIFAQFNDISMAGKLLSFYSGETSHAVDLDTYESEVKEHNAKNKHFRYGMAGKEENSWIDYDDFIEMEEHEILSPDTDVKIIPFFSTPRFTYFREFTLEHPEGLHPFGHEPSHKCLIGINSPNEVQAQLVELRSTEVNFKLNEYIKKAKELAHSHDPADEKERQRLEREIAYWKNKVHNLHNLRDKFVHDSEEPSGFDITKLNSRMTSGSGSVNELRPQISQALLMYSTISSLEQAREVINANSLLSDYHNRFLIHNLKLIWNNQVRDIFTSFLYVVSHRETEALAMSRKALDLMDRLLKSSEPNKREQVSEPSFVSQNEFTCGNDVIEAFEEYMTSLECDTEEIESKYLVKFIKPQIHLRSDSNPKANVLMASKDIELRVFCVNHEGTDDIITDSEENISLLETRYGVLCRDSVVLSFQEEDFPFKTKDPYGSGNKRHVWPFWLNLEDNGDLEQYKKNLVIEKTTIAFSLKKPNMLAMVPCKGHSRKGEVVVHMAKLVLNATSKQYCAFYFILTDLLIHGNEKNYFLQRIEQISSVSEASDIANLADKLKLLQNNIRICRFLILKMNENSLKLSHQKRRQHGHLKLELCRMKIELWIIIKSLEVKGSSYRDLKAMSKTWAVHVDQLIFHILTDAREPMIDFALATSSFTRSEEADGSNANSVEISLMQGFNLQKDVVYPELLKPYRKKKNEEGKEDTYVPSKPMVSMSWKMLNPVGGIRVMNNANLSVQPMQVQLDYDTSTKLFNYLFPKNEEKIDNYKRNNQNKTNNGFASTSEGDEGYDSAESPTTLSSPSRAFKNLWEHSKLSKSESSSIFTRSSPSRDTFSGESVSVSSNDAHLSRRRSTNEKGIHRTSSKKQASIPDDITVIMNRSAQYFVVGDFKVNKTKLCISFKAPKHLNIIDVHNLEFSLPSIHYRDKTWTSNDFILQFKKDVVKIFLSNTGKIIGNKFKIKKRQRVSTPLRQIMDFSKYMSLEDLQDEGRARGSISIFADKSEEAPDSVLPQNTHGSHNLSSNNLVNKTIEGVLGSVRESEETESEAEKS